MPKILNNENTTGFSHYFEFDYLDLQRTGYLANLGAANQVKVGSLPPGGAVSLAAVLKKTAAAGASDITLDLGVTAADPDEFIDNVDIDGLTKASYNTGDALTVSGDDGTLYVNNTASAVDIIAEINGTHANLTAGAWVIGWKQWDLNTFAITE